MLIHCQVAQGLKHHNTPNLINAELDQSQDTSANLCVDKWLFLKDLITGADI